MGYTSEMFAEISGLIKPGARVMDMGSQDIHIPNEADLAELNRFTAIQVAPPCTIPSRLVFETAGFDYSCIDVDERPGTIHLDISTLAFPKQLRAGFDYVGNTGTTEHLANPVAGFALIHYLTKPGGIMFHDVPISGWANHALANPTPKFWHLMIQMNGYELISCSVRETPDPKTGDFHNPGWTYMHGLMTVPSSIARFSLRKPGKDFAFIPPHDGYLPDDEGSLIKLLMGSLSPFIAAGTYSEEECAKSIKQSLAFQKPSLIFRALRKAKRILGV